MLQQDGSVAWPQVECSVPVCAVQPASAARLQCWHKQWDAWTKGHTEAVGALADKMEALLKEAQQGKGEGNSKGNDIKRSWTTSKWSPDNKDSCRRFNDNRGCKKDCPAATHIAATSC